MDELNAEVADARHWVEESSRIVVLTGVGISTDSGIPDFRGPQGVWTKNPTAEKLSNIHYYMTDPDVRRLAWQSRLEHPTWRAAPNGGHEALVRLERRGSLLALVTQNIDGLHQRAGNSPTLVIEVHGTVHEVICMRCGMRGPMQETLDRVRAGEDDPSCLPCGGILKSATIGSFRLRVQRRGASPPNLSPAGLRPAGQAVLGLAFALYGAAGYGLGLASLVLNSFVARPEIRRRTRVMFWGTAVGVLSVVVLVGYIESRGLRGTQILSLPFWVWVGPVLALYLLPLSFAYAVVRYRVMEFPVRLKRSARYVVVHHAIVVVGLVIGVALTFFFAWAFTRVLPVGPAGSMSAGPLSGLAGAPFGVLVAVATRGAVRRATERVDRAFFRGAYDGRRLLQDLARETRASSNRRQLATLLERSLKEAFHPSSIVVLFRTAAGRLEPVTPDGSPAWSIDAAEVEREPLAKTGATVVGAGELPAPLAALAGVLPDLLVPMQGIDEHLEGMLVLGPRLSDEPYGREDRELVASVANQAGTVLENLRLARAVAERLEAERAAGRELEIAREVQSKLLPQQAPVLESLDYFGVCVQARLVGGDYSDFLYLGPGRLGFVLADISGKGISAALLMASLQASLRSQYAQAPDDLPRVLRAVNRTFFDSTATSRYATLFFAIYDETTGRLQDANCGHPPPVLLGRDGAIGRLLPTGTVIGLFEEWDCRIQEIDLKPGDTLAMFTDGFAEAFNAEFEEFGEERIVDLIRAQAELPAVTIVEALVDAVRRHSGPAQSDDFTVVVVRGRAPSIDPEPDGLRRVAA